MMKVANEIVLVSVVIPVYKTEKYLLKCLNSVLTQTYTLIEIIIIDDGSPDNAYLIAEDYCKKDNRIYLIRQKNAGLSAARNTGILATKGKYLLFLDSDDELVPDAIENLVKIAETESSSMVIPDRYYKIFESTGKKTLVYHFPEKDKTSNPIDFALKVIIGLGRAWRATSVLYSNEIIRNNKITFPIGYTSEDITFNLAFLAYIDKISFCSIATLMNLKREDSITTTFNANLIDMFLFIDGQVNNFLITNQIDTKTGLKYQDSLLCRNTIIALTYLMGPKNPDGFLSKYNNGKEILRISRINDAFRRKTIVLPYFQEVKVKLYFKIILNLLSKRMHFLAFFIIYLGGRFSIKS